ncbi:hypothetical protein [Streptomyces sp. DK15]|uniref:hypothetical protein n=1 Tax=Streptomyces sp. DK15 TaxID=2957499 RepID=UPI0029C08052|nr:hypothetical protein [Streptomyces sp. DK15]
MSGGGLTRRERHRIALGTVEGLACAEIVLGLDLPTSAVAREVLAATAAPPLTAPTRPTGPPNAASATSSSRTSRTGR